MIRLQDPALCWRVWVIAVRVSFENSTVCRAIESVWRFVPNLFVWLQHSASVGCCGQCLLVRVLLESLILAQDERWRRA